MAKSHGLTGILKAAGNAVGHVQSFSYNPQQEEAESYGMGDQWAENYSGVKRWSASVVVEFDPQDTGQQGLVVQGSNVALEIQPQGSGSGLPELSGNAKVTSKPVTVEKGAMTQQSFEIVGTGALTEGTQT